MIIQELCANYVTQFKKICWLIKQAKIRGAFYRNVLLATSQPIIDESRHNYVFFVYCSSARFLKTLSTNKYV